MNTTIVYGVSHGLISFPPPAAPASAKQRLAHMKAWECRRLGLSSEEMVEHCKAYRRDWQRVHRAELPKRQTKIDVHRSQFPDGPEGGKRYHIAYMKAWRENR